MPFSTVVPGGIWFAGPMQQTWPAPKTPCQLTLQPPSWFVIESALGPVTTTLAVGDSGSTLFWLRSRVIDSCAALSVAVAAGGDRRVGRVGVDARRVRIADARLVEQAELELQREDPPHRLVDPRLLDRARVHVLQRWRPAIDRRRRPACSCRHRRSRPWRSPRQGRRRRGRRSAAPARPGSR